MESRDCAQPDRAPEHEVTSCRPVLAKTRMTCQDQCTKCRLSITHTSNISDPTSRPREANQPQRSGRRRPGWPRIGLTSGWVSSSDLLLILMLIPQVTASALTSRVCNVECGRERYNPVCGSDGHTYNSRCALEREKCSGKDLTVSYSGICKSGVWSDCLEERRTAVITSTESGIPVFVPECESDGEYRPVQCHSGSGYCWCVDETGKPVPGTSMRYSRPSCRRHLKGSKGDRYRRVRGSRRGGQDESSRKNSRRRGSPGRRRRKSVCTQADRSSFNKNLIEMMTTEHRSLPSTGSNGEPSLTGSPEREVVEWKFSQLDANRDGILNKRETKLFRKNIRKMLRPVKCARSFLRFCDMDSDRRISPSEWKTCIGIEVNISFKLFLSLNSDEDDERRRQEKQRKSEAMPTGEDSLPMGRPPSREDSLLSRRPLAEDSRPLDLPQSSRAASLIDSSSGSDAERILKQSRGTFSLLQDDHQSVGDSPTSVGADQDSDCMKERREANREARDGNDATFVPDCETNGLYKEVQCYKSTGYCWCVDRNSGRPIPGTSTRHSQPNCAVPNRKEWDKCEGNKREEFLSQLYTWMRSRMSVISADSNIQLRNEKLSLDERTVIWQFGDLDTNKDGSLTRRELRQWRQSLRSVSGLAACGKRLVKYCDINSDRRISNSEWRACLASPKDQKASHAPAPVSNRRGPNPLKTWLKGD